MRCTYSFKWYYVILSICNCLYIVYLLVRETFVMQLIQDNNNNNGIILCLYM